MIKNKPDYKLFNIAILFLIFYLIYQTSNVWLGILGTLWKIIMPFFFAFVVAYAFYPFLKYMQKKGIPKAIAILIIVAIIIAVVILVGSLIVPLMFDQLVGLFNSILSFVKNISLDYDLNLGTLQDSLNSAFNDIIASFGKYVSDGAVTAISISLDVLSKVFIAASVAVYLLSDMDKIRLKVGKYLRKTNKRLFLYVKELDNQMKRYLTGFLKIAFITIFEYGGVFMIIGHPNAILLGFLACIASLIPYFGGIAVNCIAAITAFVVSPALFIRTVIAFVILSNVDGYLINPFVYGKTNQIHPVICIMSVFAGGILFGILGIVISLPLAIILLTTFKFFKNDINVKVDGIKDRGIIEKS